MKRGRTETQVCSVPGRNRKLPVKSTSESAAGDRAAPPAGPASCSYPSALILGPEGAHWHCQGLGHTAQGTPFPAQTGRAGVSTAGAAVGVGWGWHLGSTFSFSSLSYLKCSSWLRTVGRKKRDLKRERSHTTVNSEAKEENTAGGKGQEAEPACLPACPPACLPACLPACPHRDQEPGNLFGECCVD